MSFRRKIEFAYDAISCRQIKASEELKSKSGYKLRNNYADNLVKPICIECGQPLIIAGGVKVIIYFRHKDKLKDCILRDETSTKELQIFNQIHSSKESERHKELKNKIGNYLKITKGVENVWIDDRFIFDRSNKSLRKKPDVYCEFHNKKIVFEIQLSELSNKYIRSRYHFYKRNGIYLIWVLEDIELIKNGKTRMRLDLQYLTQHQNLFKLDENSSSLKLKCNYKDYFIDYRTVKEIWRETNITLHQLKFSAPEFQVFYKNGLQNKEIQEKKLDILLTQDKVQKSQQRIKESDDQIKYLFQVLKQAWETSNPELIIEIVEIIEEFDAYDLTNLREKISNKNNKGIPFHHNLIVKANIEHLRLIDVILTYNSKFNIDTNRNTVSGKTILQSLLENKKLHNENKKKYLVCVLNNGYRIQKNDLDVINDIYNGMFSNEELTLLDTMLSLVLYHFDSEELFKHWRFICLLASIKEGKFIGYNYQQGLWVAFANNAIDSYKNRWEVIEEAFKLYGLWDNLLQLDKKNTFKRKYEKLKRNFPEQDKNIYYLLSILFPELSIIRKVDFNENEKKSGIYGSLF